MADQVVPALPCRTLEEALPFYEALGFAVTYRQRRPNPYAVVERNGAAIHLYGIAELDPAATHSTLLLVVDDVEATHAAFADGLKAAFGQVPRSGIPRMTRPRRKHGTVGGFSVVDPAGCWLRVSQLGDREDEQPPTTGLRRAIEVAARLADAKGDIPAGRRHLAAALAAHPDAPDDDIADATAYLAELDDQL